MAKKIDYSKVIDDFDEVEASSGDVKIVLEYIGEGTSGDYNSLDKNDIPLLRFTTFKKEYVSQKGTGTDHPDWNWEEVDGGSYCTQIPINTPKDKIQELAITICSKMKKAIKDENVGETGEELSWISDKEIAR
jgi:hypothetical protein